MSLDWADLRRRSLQPGGFADDRQHIWPRLLNVNPKRSLAPSSSSAPEPHRDEFQIQLDTARSFVLYPHNSSDNQRAQLQKDLHQLIVTLFRKRPKLNYFQGYHDIATVMFLTLPGELQIPCLEHLSLHRLRDSMGAGLEPVLGLLRVTKNLIELADPDMSAMLNQSAQLPFFALSNLLTLFSHDMPSLPLIQHVFDYLLCRPPIAAVYLATAIILARKEEVRRLQAEDEDGMVHSLLSSLPNLMDDISPPPSDLENDAEAGDNIPSQHNGPPHPSADGEGSVESDSPNTTDTTIVVDSPSSSSIIDSVSNRLEMETSFSSVPDSDFTLVEPDFAGPHKTTSPSKGTAAVLTLIEEHQQDKLAQSPNPVTYSIPISPPRTPSAQSSPLPLSPSPLLPPSSPLLLPVRRDLPTPSPLPSSFPSKLPSPSQSPLPPSFPSRPPSPSPSPLRSRSSSLPPSTSPSPPPSNSLTLTSLLSHADKLYELYPPTHSQLSLSLIMGPQSTIYTWSEQFRDLPSNEEAEMMVIRPDLVVYPYDPHDENSSISSSSRSSSDTETHDEAERKEKDKKGARRRKLTKSSKQHEKRQEKERKKSLKEKKRASRKERKHRKRFGLVSGTLEEKRAVLAGAVVVVGIAMAVYGAKQGGGSSGGGGRFGFGGSGELNKMFRNVGKLIGGMIGGRHWPWS